MSGVCLITHAINGILSKSTRVQNQPDKNFYFCYLLIYFKNFLNFFVYFLFIFNDKYYP